MTEEEKNKLVDPEEIIHTGSASHGFGSEDFEEELTFEDDEDDDDDENTVEDG
jgi:phosphopantothenoylcysteine synthetase/decarboxylase